MVDITATADGYQGTSATISITDYEAVQITISTSIISELGGQTTGRVTRNAADTANPLVVQLTSTDTSEATVPATITIPAGQVTAIFNIFGVDDTLLDGVQTVSITAAANNYESSSATLMVADHETLLLTSPTMTISERDGVATVRVSRSNTDTNAELILQLSSSDASAATIPTTVTIPAGQASATFPVTAIDDRLLDGTQAVTLTATASGYEPSSLTLSVTDYESLTLTFDVTAISELDGRATGTITRDNTDVDTPLVIQLTNNDATAAVVPTTVTIPTGQSSVTFELKAIDDDLLDGSQSVSIGVTASGYQGTSASINVTDYETLALIIDTDAISERDGRTSATVTRGNTNIDLPLVVQLTSNEPAAVTIPTSVNIPAGAAFAVFNIFAVDDTLLDGTQTLSISASSSGYSSIAQTLRITDYETLGLTIDVASISELGGQTSGRVTRNNTDLSAALVVELASSDTSEALLPTTVTIQPGQAFATFLISAVDDTLLDDSQALNVVAAVAGYQDATASLTITDHEKLNLTIDSATLSELSAQTIGRISRSNGDVGLPLTVQLSSSDSSEATVPATVTIPAGLASTTFVITAVDDALLDGTQSSSISAAAVGYVSASANVNVTDFETLSLALDNSLISEFGGRTLARVTRNNTDLALPLTVTIAANDLTEVSLPTSVTIAAGQASASFTIDTVDDTVLDALQAVTIDVHAEGYASESATLEVSDWETLSLSLSVTSISEKNGTAIATIARSNTDNAQLLVVTIASSDPSRVSVPATVTILAGQSSVTVEVQAIDNRVFAGSQTIEILATAAGYAGQAESSLTVTDDDRQFPWQSPRNSLDVNDSGQVTPLDALLVINAINIRQALTPELPDPFIPVAYVDVNGDNNLSAIDALLVINYLNVRPGGEGEYGWTGDILDLPNSPENKRRKL